MLFILGLTNYNHLGILGYDKPSLMITISNDWDWFTNSEVPVAQHCLWHPLFTGALGPSWVKIFPNMLDYIADADSYVMLINQVHMFDSGS